MVHVDQRFHLTGQPAKPVQRGTDAQLGQHSCESTGRMEESHLREATPLAGKHKIANRIPFTRVDLAPAQPLIQ